jgi:16S rRNA (adenine1518-N6/adenine1519-N6)-dimethyltransferase
MSEPHRARKRFGQNFLHDKSVIERIVAAIRPQRTERMVEIGPGLAALTRPLLAQLDHLSVVELDRDLVARLRNDFAPTHLTVHEADALKFDFAALGPDLRVVGNLPYNISSPLLFHLATFGNLRDMHFMLQKEVVLRMAAAPDTADYGRLSVMLQAQFAVEMCFIVPPDAFTPAPKVDSAIVRLIPLPSDQIAWRHSDRERFASVVAQAFSQRRKTLRNTLKGLISAEQMSSINIDPNRRAETLSVADFARLTALTAGETPALREAHTSP